MDEDTKIQDIIDNNLEIPLFASDLDPGDDLLTFTASFDPSDKIETYTINQLTNSTAELLVEPIDNFNGKLKLELNISEVFIFCILISLNCWGVTPLGKITSLE